MSPPKALVSSYLGVLAMAGLIFIAGGKLLYWQAWLYLGLAILGTTLTHLLTPQGSHLAAHRANTARTGEAWDRRIMGLYFLLSILTFVVAGLDSGRFGWSGPMPWFATVLGSLVIFSGQVLFALARRENAFFASLVQIEAARGHAVCTSGPYQLIRHPGYLGMALSLMGFPFVLGSYWACLPVALCLITVLRRTQLEDSYLHERLAGYAQYASAVNSKLIPFIF